jgi:hypothetical protein
MDPIALVASAVSATMVSVLLFVLPGAALGPVVLPGATTPLARLGRAAGVSLLVSLILCTILARLGILTEPVLVGSLVAITALGFVLHRPTLRRPSRRARRWLAIAGAGIVLAGALIVVPSVMGASPGLLPKSSTTWYYANLAQAVAAIGGIPAQLPEWGADRPFQTDYLPVTAQTAGALLLLPGDLLADLEVYRVVMLTLALLFATLLFRRWVSSWVALLGAILLIGTVRLDAKFDGYRPETVALVVALFTLWVADRAFAERSPRAFGVALVGTTLVFLSHAEVFLILAPALVGLGVARLLVAPGSRRTRLGWRGRPRRRDLAAPIAAVALVLGGVVLGALSGWALTGETRILGYAVGQRGDTTAVDGSRGRPGEVPAGWTFTNDPTWDFYVASVAPALEGSQPPDSLTDTLLLPRSILQVWSGLDGRLRSGLAVLAVLVIAPALAWPFLDARRRRLVLAWWVFALLLVAGSLLLYLVSDTYVPARTPGRRLLPYLLFVPVVAMLVVLWAVDRLIRPGWRALLPRRGRALAAGLALAVLTVGAVSASPLQTGVVDDQGASLSSTGYDAYRWIDANLPADARILANAYTDGAIAAVAHRVGIVDGRAVYLENRQFLAESTALVLGSRVVFGTPAAPGAGTFLEREGVTHLLVSTAGPDGTDLGGYLLFDTDLDALRADPRFRLVRSFGDDRLLLFEVVRPTAMVSRLR